MEAAAAVSLPPFTAARSFADFEDLPDVPAFEGNSFSA
jgi:hypothetical protein